MLRMPLAVLLRCDFLQQAALAYKLGVADRIICNHVLVMPLWASQREQGNLSSSIFFFANDILIVFWKRVHDWFSAILSAHRRRDACDRLHQRIRVREQDKKGFKAFSGSQASLSLMLEECQYLKGEGSVPFAPCEMLSFLIVHWLLLPASHQL